MRAEIKITGSLLAQIHADLARHHAFAHERVGFLTCGIVGNAWSGLTLLTREYRAVADADYIQDPSVGAMIGADAMRKALQLAYAAKSALFHIHSHGGHGIPQFSSVDIRESQKFVPSFFNVVPQMPHGAIVLSGNSARGLKWLAPDRAPITVTGFKSIGSPLRQFGGAYELA